MSTMPSTRQGERLASRTLRTGTTEPHPGLATGAHNSQAGGQGAGGPDLRLVQDGTGCPRTAAVLREILLGDLRCRRRWQRHAQRTGAQQPNQAGVAWVLALTLWDRGEVSESRRTLPRSLKDRVSRALNGTLVSASTLALFVDAFDLSPDQEQRLYAAWDADGGQRW